MDRIDGCMPSKLKQRNEEVGPPIPTLLDQSVADDFGSQPATQPLTESQESMSDDQSSMSQDDKPWGILYPYRPEWRPVEMFSDEISVGRSNSNTHAITANEGGRLFFAISKVHFVIRKSRDGILIEDKSSNGTAVNGQSIGRNKAALTLNHNAFISIAKSKVYVFMFTQGGYMSEYPKELREKYVVSRDLGTGACGIVRLGFHLDSKVRRYPVAIKIVSKKLTDTANIPMMNEVNILRSVNHPSIIRLEDVVETKENLYIILELARGGELFDKIIQKTKFNEREAKIHFYQMVSGIEYLHSKQIAHRDLKPENILLCSEEDSTPVIKITDLGLSKLVKKGTHCKTFCGTPQYLAPEVIINQAKGNGTYDFKVDMWSLGVILYVLLCGCPPFNPNSKEKSLTQQIVSGDFTFPKSQWSGISDDAVDLIKNLLKTKPTERLSAAEALQHPWLLDQEVVESIKRLWSTMGYNDADSLCGNKRQSDESLEEHHLSKRVKVGECS